MKNTLSALLIAASALTASAQQHQLTAKEKQQGWHQLFNGQNTEGWHTYLQPKAGEAWKVVDGTLQLDPKAPGQGDLVTDKEYENFDLSVEWKISPEGNSGIIFGVHEAPEYHNTFDTGIEMQVLDNEKAEDNKKANHLAGSLYDMEAPSQQNVAKPAGEWNHAEIKKKNGRLTFYLNSKEIINVQMGSTEWKRLIDDSKFKSWKGFAAYSKGKIALQDHGHEVAFRNIMIKDL